MVYKMATGQRPCCAKPLPCVYGLWALQYQSRLRVKMRRCKLSLFYFLSCILCTPIGWFLCVFGDQPHIPDAGNAGDAIFSA